jgi:hypothetical protein
MEAEAVSETSDYNAILIRLITREEFTELRVTDTCGHNHSPININLILILESRIHEAGTVMLQSGADLERRTTPGHVDGRVRPSERQLRVAAQCSGCLDKHTIRFRTNECPWSGYCGR